MPINKFCCIWLNEIHRYKAGKTCEDPHMDSELCCTTEDKEVYANVWSLRSHGPTGSDSMLTSNSTEFAQLKSAGWIEQCNPIIGPTVFCVNVSLEDGRAGPFMLWVSFHFFGQSFLTTYRWDYHSLVISSYRNITGTPDPSMTVRPDHFTGVFTATVHDSTHITFFRLILNVKILEIMTSCLDMLLCLAAEKCRVHCGAVAHPSLATSTHSISSVTLLKSRISHWDLCDNQQ